jgi:hypothetical protein
LTAAETASLVLEDSAVDAPLPARGPVTLRGASTLPPLPLHWLGIFALVALALAVVLETTRKLRERGREWKVRAPAHVRNTA